MQSNLVFRYGAIVSATASLILGFLWFVYFPLTLFSDFIISAISAFFAIIIGVGVILFIRKHKENPRIEFKNISNSLARMGIILGILFFILLAALWIFLFLYEDQIAA